MSEVVEVGSLKPICANELGISVKTKALVRRGTFKIEVKLNEK